MKTTRRGLLLGTLLAPLAKLIQARAEAAPAPVVAAPRRVEGVAAMMVGLVVTGFRFDVSFERCVVFGYDDLPEDAPLAWIDEGRRHVRGALRHEKPIGWLCRSEHRDVVFVTVNTTSAGAIYS